MNAAILPLEVDRRSVALPKQRRRIASQEKRRHQVFEHRPIPRDERKARLLLCDWTSEEEPMLGSNVSFRNREKTRQPRLRRQQVVVVRVDPTRAYVVTDVEQPRALVEEHAKVHSLRPSCRPRRDVLQSIKKPPMFLRC